MAVEILYDPKRQKACLFCNGNWAFGPLFESTAEAEAFLEYNGDPRSLTDSEMEDAVSRFREAHELCELCGAYLMLHGCCGCEMEDEDAS